ncbi:MAG: NADH-quinone oxidoreductase subunit A [Thermoguttaceae bacterium]
MSPTSLVACLVLFAAVGGLFLLVALGLGRLLRAAAPSAAKLEPYECGEPPIGSSLVQFDLRFYVVALVFIVFEVELALFFPPATVFGKATWLMGAQVPATEARQLAAKLGELGMDEAVCGAVGESQMVRVEGRSLADVRALAAASMIDLGVFFAVILVGFAYVWCRGDLDWVRAIGSGGPRAAAADLRVLGE